MCRFWPATTSIGDFYLTKALFFIYFPNREKSIVLKLHNYVDVSLHGFDSETT